MKSKNMLQIIALLFILSQLMMACASPFATRSRNRVYDTMPQGEAGAADYEEVIESPPAQQEAPRTGESNVNDAAFDATFFEDYGVNPFIDTEDDNLSTFATDVDTGAYTVGRRYVNDGYLPDPDSVRVEEYVNYFDYQYTPPAEDAFAISLEGAPSPFGTERHKLLRVGLQGRVISAEDRKDVALTFVIDVSGSMSGPERLGLAKRSLEMLVEQLRPTDTVSIIVYGDRAKTVLPPRSVSAENQGMILDAIHSLESEGATNAEEGLRMAYESAWSEFNSQAINRIILVSDGVANVGRTGAGSIWEQIEQYAERGITLTSIGIGMGNYNDVMMEQLADNGNGTYAYVDTQDEARRIFVDELTGTLQTIAFDAKVQVDFNLETVRSYRLIGYENRAVDDDDFRNDETDAGEIGAGHSVTALYEIKLEREADENEASFDADEVLATVYVRYQDAETEEVSEISQVLSFGDLHERFDDSSPSFQLAAAVAEYAEVLRESYWAQESNLDSVLDLASQVSELYNGQNGVPEKIEEFVGLVEAAIRIEGN